MKSVSAARDRYRLHLEEQKKDKVQKEIEIDSKKQEMTNELQSVKENCQRMQDLIRKFDIKLVNLAKKPKKTIILNS